VGLCYDSGHGNKGEDGLRHLDRLKHRLIAVHLHDNDGTADQHLIPFTGTVDWERLAQILSCSPYTGPVNIETMMHKTGLTDEGDFLARTYAAATRVNHLVEQRRLSASAASPDSGCS
jgi:sugar phosphate isomerase/epimerase